MIRLLSLMTFLIFFSVIHGQTYKVLYASKMTFNELKFEKMPLEIRKQVKEALNARLRIYALTNLAGKSEYHALYSTYNGKKELDTRWIAESKRVVLFKDFLEGYYLRIIDDSDVAVKEYFDKMFTWKIDQDRDTTIYGFSCKRATTQHEGKPVDAWFTPSIPIMDGPSHYAGLPGLILRIKTAFGITEVVDIQIIKNNKEEIIIPKKKKYISSKEMKESRTLTVKAKRIKKKE